MLHTVPPTAQLPVYKYSGQLSSVDLDVLTFLPVHDEYIFRRADVVLMYSIKPEV